LAQLAATQRLLSGAVLLMAPRAVSAAVAGKSDPPPAWLIRLLGARMLLQAAVELRFRRRAVVAAATGVDGMHAMSMPAAARRWPRCRRAALASAAEATVAIVMSAAYLSSPER
jgi:hypothetical protein